MGTGEIRTVPGYRELEPLRQGTLDKLCGIYAVINAATLAAFPVQPLTKRQQQGMFDVGIRFLAKPPLLLDVNLEGMNERLWMRLRDEMLRQLVELRGPELKASALLMRKSADIKQAAAIVAASVRSGRPVSLAMWGAYDHFSVVGGISPTGWMLFDSYGFRRVKMTSLGVRHPHSWSRHRISLRSIAAILATDG